MYCRFSSKNEIGSEGNSGRKEKRQQDKEYLYVKHTFINTLNTEEHRKDTPAATACSMWSGKKLNFV